VRLALSFGPMVDRALAVREYDHAAPQQCSTNRMILQGRQQLYGRCGSRATARRGVDAMRQGPLPAKTLAKLIMLNMQGLKRANAVAAKGILRRNQKVVCKELPSA
jgi:hypothetical protein